MNQQSMECDYDGQISLHTKDTHDATGDDAVHRASVDELAKLSRPTHCPGGGGEAYRDANDEAQTSDSVVVMRGDRIKPNVVNWIWQGWLARGKFHVLAGAPGTGKTTIALALAATISNGDALPDGTMATFGNVLIWSGEDDPRDTLVPRLLAMSANMTRIHFVTGTIEHGKPRQFDPSRDIASLMGEMARIGDVHLLIVDPVVAAVAADSHNNAATRRALQPLADLGTTLGCAVLGVSHYSKGTQGRDPLERVTGSLAFGALARIVWGTAKGIQKDESRRLVRAKSNIGQDGGGFEFDLEQMEVAAHPGLFASRVLWGSPIEGVARDLLAETEDFTTEVKTSELDAAKTFLIELLANGPMPSKQVFTAANTAGHSVATVRRAKTELEISVEKTSLSGGWTWRLTTKILNVDEGAHR